MCLFPNRFLLESGFPVLRLSKKNYQKVVIGLIPSFSKWAVSLAKATYLIRFVN